MATTSMTVDGIQFQAPTKYNLLKNATGGFRKITVIKDNGAPPPALGAASGNKYSTWASVVASDGVWGELEHAMEAFPFTAIITHDQNGLITDLSFKAGVSGGTQ